jgi:hypothetical protein
MQGSSRRAILLLLAFAAFPARADWKDDYARGLEAVRAGNWTEAQRLMDSAIAGNPQPVARVRLYGQRFEIYAPQHYAGLAALRREDCATAMRYWEQAANTSFVGTHPELADVQRKGRGECGTQLASRTPASRDATPPAPVPAPTTAPPAPATAAPSSQAAPAAIAQTQVPARTSPTPAQTPLPMPSAPPPKPVVEQAPPVSIAAETLRPLLAAYLGGRYTEVLRLSTRAPDDARLRWHVLTLRAAAAFSLAQIGDTPANAETTARQAVNEARRLAPNQRPDLGFYSPKFVRFFDTR